MSKITDLWFHQIREVRSEHCTFHVNEFADFQEGYWSKLIALPTSILLGRFKKLLNLGFPWSMWTWNYPEQIYRILHCIYSRVPKTSWDIYIMSSGIIWSYKFMGKRSDHFYRLIYFSKMTENDILRFKNENFQI